MQIGNIQNCVNFKGVKLGRTNMMDDFLNRAKDEAEEYKIIKEINQMDDMSGNGDHFIDVNPSFVHKNKMMLELRSRRDGLVASVLVGEHDNISKAFKNLRTKFETDCYLSSIEGKGSTSAERIYNTLDINA